MIILEGCKCFFQYFSVHHRSALAPSSATLKLNQPGHGYGMSETVDGDDSLKCPEVRVLYSLFLVLFLYGMTCTCLQKSPHECIPSGLI